MLETVSSFDRKNPKPSATVYEGCSRRFENLQFQRNAFNRPSSGSGAFGHSGNPEISFGELEHKRDLLRANLPILSR